MNKNLTKNILLTFLFTAVFILGMYLVFTKTDLFPSASKSRAELRWENRSTKAESALITTPTVETKANLTDALKELDSISPDTVAKDLPQNDADSNSL